MNWTIYYLVGVGLSLVCWLVFTLAYFIKHSLLEEVRKSFRRHTAPFVLLFLIFGIIIYILTTCCIIVLSWFSFTIQLVILIFLWEEKISPTKEKEN